MLYIYKEWGWNVNSYLTTKLTGCGSRTVSGEIDMWWFCSAGCSDEVRKDSGGWKKKVNMVSHLAWCWQLRWSQERRSFHVFKKTEVNWTLKTNLTSSLLISNWTNILYYITACIWSSLFFIKGFFKFYPQTQHVYLSREGKQIFKGHNNTTNTTILIKLTYPDI